MSRNGGENFQKIVRSNKLSKDELEAKLDLRRGSRTSPINGKRRANDRRAKNARQAALFQDA